MHSFKSEKVVLSKKKEVVLQFLHLLDNHQQLMPPNIINWQNDADTCSFELKNLAKLTMQVDERNDAGLKLSPSGKTPVNFTMHWNVNENGENTEVQIEINADVNPFLKMMVQKPLQDLIDYEMAAFKKVV